jgi:sterol desaturase/sphingolipid hydroxylase (fatty acid hydroxylase superfamily)
MNCPERALQWHHDRESGGTCHYANLMPLLDILFGTCRSPEAAPRNFGVNEGKVGGYLAQLVEPLLPSLNHDGS